MINRVSGQLFPKRWAISNPNPTKNNMNKHKVKRHRNSDTKTGNRGPQQNYRLGTVSDRLLGGGGLTNFTGPTSPSVSEVVKTFNWLFGSHDNPLTRQ